MVSANASVMSFFWLMYGTTGCVLFERKNARNRESEEDKERTDALERTLGRVVVEKEFLVKKCKELGIEP